MGNDEVGRGYSAVEAEEIYRERTLKELQNKLPAILEQVKQAITDERRALGIQAELRSRIQDSMPGPIAQQVFTLAVEQLKEEASPR